MSWFYDSPYTQREAPFRRSTYAHVPRAARLASGPEVELVSFELEQAVWRAIHSNRFFDISLQKITAMDLSLAGQAPHIRWDIQLTEGRVQKKVTQDIWAKVVRAAMRDRDLTPKTRRLFYHAAPV